MTSDALIAARVPVETKERFALVARYHGVSESVLLRRLVDAAFITAAMPKDSTFEPVRATPVSGKISVRLRPDDCTLLRERAATRQMPTGTYVADLLRSHLRNLAPLPTRELEALKRSVAELGAIGRNLNQIARAVNGRDENAESGVAHLPATMKAIADLRDYTKALIKANALSWRVGNT